MQLSDNSHDNLDANSPSVLDLLQVMGGAESPVVVQNITESDGGVLLGGQPANVPGLSDLLNLGNDPAVTPDLGLGKDLKERERELILATLRVTGGSRKLAAERLGISPRTLRHKLQQFKAAGVTVPRLHNEEFAAV